MTSRLRIRSILVPLATLGFLLAELIDPAPVWKALMVTFGGLWLLTYVWARSLQRNLRLERAMRYGWAQVGDRLEEQFTLINEGFLPATWLELSDQSTLPGYSIARGTGIEASSQNRWTTNGTCSRRGVYTLGRTRLLTGDPLGIYRVEILQPEAVTLTVMPPMIPLQLIEIAAGGWQGEGRPRVHSTQQTVRAETVRPYEPGDSLRLVHWHTTARRDEPYVRVLEGAPASDWWIILDFEQRVQAGDESAESTAELAVILAASLAERGLRAHRSVGLIASAREPVWMRPGAGERQHWEIMRTLAVLETGSARLSILLEGLGPALGPEANLIVITPSVDSEWVTALSKLSWRGATSTAILIDPSSFGADQSIVPLARLLTEIGIPNYIAGRELFQRPEAHPGPSGQWEWRILPTGKAVPIRRPADMTWKNLQ